eukprot:RCo047284
MVATDLVVRVEERDFPLQKAVLQLASPVFNRMIFATSTVTTPQILALAGKAEEFEEFLKFLYPPTHRSCKLSAENVDFLLAWFHDFEIAPLKEECEELLLTLPVTEDRLLQASKYGLVRQRARCIEEIATRCEDFSLERLVSCVDVLPQLVLRMREVLVAERGARARSEEGR